MITNKTIKTHGNFIACEPLPPIKEELKKDGGFVSIDRRTSLVQLKVVFGDSLTSFIQPATLTHVYISGKDSYIQPWAAKIYTLGEYTFILVPKEAVVLEEHVFNGYTLTNDNTFKITPEMLLGK
jgi:hypothetical protein